MMGLHQLHTAHMEARYEMRVDSQTITSSNFPRQPAIRRIFAMGSKAERGEGRGEAVAREICCTGSFSCPRIGNQESALTAGGC
ncbi:hypothetical protein CSHISOI_09247 [Colletotrichum shisoi]|uniref:Uncharacterized protein n=1 Tax=Colletotrichum shisoi TaxID=2078593 RepID=A0A5Q4BHK5_9PEZI|nr:hypothetical protein CSHISOI_09247 [Colletotrichum shisoi]